MEEIKQADPAAVVVNGYYSGYLGEDRNLDELTAGVRRHYENGYSNIGEFIEAHDDRLPPELIEEARAAAHAAGLPFSEKAYRDGEEPDPYLFDGSMSMEDYELMHRMISCMRNTGGTLLSMTGADLPSRAISTITVIPLQNGMTGATCRRNTG